MKQNLYRILLLFVLFAFIVPIPVYANSAQPPALVIIMKNAPEDAAVSLDTNDGFMKVPKRQVAWETYFLLYSFDMGFDSVITLQISGNGTQYELTIGSEYLNRYDSIVTLDFAARTITHGKLLSRSILLVSIRVILTLIIEGTVFLLFDFRDKRSWMVFIIMNLVTQGALNIALNRGGPIQSYLILYLIVLELFVFIAEIVGSLVFIKEQRGIRRIMFVLVANLTSLVAGITLITALPV